MNTPNPSALPTVSSNTQATLGLPAQLAASGLADVLRRAPRSARIAVRLLTLLKIGTLDVQFPDGSTARFGQAPLNGKAAEPIAGIALKDWSACEAALKSGDIGFAETYIAGSWTTPKLVSLLELLIANRTALEAAFYGTWWGTLLHRLKHLFKRNTQVQAKKNIQAHYDLGNDFYRLWLDDSMTYSSALFSGVKADANKSDLTLAQHAKYQRVLNEIGVTQGSKVLEIGCGWGGFAEIAALSGVHVTGLTLSHEQLAFASERLNKSHPALAEFRLQDYRDEAAQYDGIASIEMFEAVGETYWPSYFACIKRNLKPGGKACVQSIVIADELFARYRASTDFIQQYIFPGGMLASPQIFREQAERAGLKVINELAFGQDYAETLKRWREAFLARLVEVRQLGYDEKFIRTWEFYLAYCEAAFAQGNTDVMHFTLEAP
jgi:cyclopropane-fatty-acyl-phospholipid synthase